MLYYVDILGSANSNATVTVNGQATYRKGEYFRKELKVDNSVNALWQGVTNVAVLQQGGTNSDIVTTNSGFVFVAKTPQVLQYDADGNLTNDSRFSYRWDGENRLLKVESLASTPVASRRKVEWQYDGMGRRIRQTEYDGSSGSWIVVSDIKMVYDGWQCIAEMNGTNNTVLRSYVWGIDLSGTQTGAGGVGGLIMTTIYTGTNAGTYFPDYDGNGNIVAYINAENGTIVADYEYGPFGELIRASGKMAKEFNILFSTKYYDWETGLYYYGYRYYSPTIGKWLSRDPIDTQNGANIYSFVGNNPLNSFDVLGLWGSDVHQVATTRWAKNIGYPDQAAYIISAADESIDHWPTTSIGGDQSYHFNRNIRGGSDTRLDHFSEHIANAKRLCTSSQNDSPKEAAIELGKALHPLQDWVAHGDFGLAMHPFVWVIHNMFSPQHDFGEPSSYPDMTWLDAVGSSDGRPAGAAIQYIGSSVIDYAFFTPGNRRWKLTKEKTESALEEFRNYVNINGGCKCKQFFGAQ